MIRKILLRAIILVLVPSVIASVHANEDYPVGITPTVPYVDVLHEGKTIRVQRNQDSTNTVKDDYALTSRKCPPFCIRPMRLAPGVETIGELELLEYLVQAADPENNILVIDSRTPDWVAKGTIPGSVNIPWTLLKADTSDPLTIAEVMIDRFGAEQLDELWDFSNAKTLVMYCNGMWCGQSPRNIMTLTKFGYPAHKIKWYRGGMQNWEALGLTTVVPGD